MPTTRTAAAHWEGSLMEGSGQVSLDSSGLGTHDVTWASRAEEPGGRHEGHREDDARAGPRRESGRQYDAPCAATRAASQRPRRPGTHRPDCLAVPLSILDAVLTPVRCAPGRRGSSGGQ